MFLARLRLIGLTKEHYSLVYLTGTLPTNYTPPHHDLESWEAEVLDRYGITSGRMLVMGSGLGREALAIARRGIRVVGVDVNPFAGYTAQQSARRAGLTAHFHQADFLALPYVSGSFDYAFLSEFMYSAIPGSTLRQAWLTNLARLLRPGGLAILNFYVECSECSMPRTVLGHLAAVLSKLPGTNPEYQPGDYCHSGHFLHQFHDEDELRRELAGAGWVIRELDWARAFAVVSAPPAS